MWDAWAVMDSAGCPAFLGQDQGGFVASFDGFTPAGDVAAARNEAIAFGMYRLLRHRFANAPQATSLLQGYDEHMATLGYDVSFTSTDYSSGDGRALGNHLAAQIIAFGQQDGSNEQNDYANTVYEPLNPSLIVDLPGNASVVDMNRWQPLTLDLFIDQSGNPIPGETPPFLSPEWGQVTSWALNDADLTSYTRDGSNTKCTTTWTARLVRRRRLRHVRHLRGRPCRRAVVGIPRPDGRRDVGHQPAASGNRTLTPPRWRRTPPFTTPPMAVRRAQATASIPRRAHRMRPIWCLEETMPESWPNSGRTVQILKRLQDTGSRF